jgi:ABC-type glycerol-3-phosphate transport system permease component
MVYDYRRGLLNWILTAIGMGDKVQIWLNDPDKVMLYVAIPLIWQWIGYYMVIILSAIAAIDSEIFEVAEIDGANAMQRAFYITLPLIKNTLLVCVTLCIAGNMKAFDHIFVMTSGGPGTDSMVMALWGWQNFAWGKLQYANTISVGILIPIHSLMVPIYMVFSNTGLNNKWFTLVIPYVAFGLPVGIFLVEGFVKTIPTALEEAAAIDGSSFTRTMFTIMLPICRPILVTIAIIQTFSCWNEFAFALILTGDSRLMTVPLALKQFTGQFTSDYPKIMAAMLLTISPILILYFVYSKHIIEGMVAGAIKG